MKKRVLHVLSSNEYSGAENIAINIIKLLETEYEFAYASPEGPITSLLQDKKITHIPIKNNSILYLNGIIKDWKADIVHAHDFRASIRTALTTYKCIKISHLHQNPNWIGTYNIKSILYQLSATRLNNILSVSDEIKKEAVFSRGKSKFSVLTNKINIDLILEASHEYLSKQYDLMFVGRLTEVKDPLKFIRIVHEIKKEIGNISAVMIGEGNLKEECKKLIFSLGLSKNIEMLGFLPNPYPVMKNSKLLVMTSLWEGFGLVAVEAMALGKPVIAPPVGGLRTIIDELNGVKCNSELDFKNTIKLMLENEEIYNKFTINAIESSKKYGRIEEWGNILRKIYK